MSIKIYNNYINIHLIYYIDKMDDTFNNIEWTKRKTLLMHLKPDSLKSIVWKSDI
jgi:hypothetical protein